MLVAVVGPSGAGKDTLMTGARARLAGDPRFVFVRRTITRPRDAGHEAHDAMTPTEFAAARQAGAFALAWDAHGMSYGIPRAIEPAMAAGHVVVANLSRTMLSAAGARYPLRVLEITAPPEVLAARLTARGREDEADRATRAARSMTLPSGIAVTTILNTGSVEDGVAAVLAVLSRAAEDARSG